MEMFHMDSFSASLMKDKREIIIAPTIYKFQNFGEFAQEFALGKRDVVLTNEFIYKPFMEQYKLACTYVFQETFGAGEPSEAMIEICLLYTSRCQGRSAASTQSRVRKAPSARRWY